MKFLGLKRTGVSAQDDITNAFVGEIQHDVFNISELLALEVLNIHADQLASLVDLPHFSRGCGRCLTGTLAWSRVGVFLPLRDEPSGGYASARQNQCGQFDCVFVHTSLLVVQLFVQVGYTTSGCGGPSGTRPFIRFTGLQIATQWGGNLIITFRITHTCTRQHSRLRIALRQPPQPPAAASVAQWQPQSHSPTGVVIGKGIRMKRSPAQAATTIFMSYEERNSGL